MKCVGQQGGVCTEKRMGPWCTHRFFVAKDLDPVSDPRKLKQLIGGIFCYVHVIRNQQKDWGLGRKS